MTTDANKLADEIDALAVIAAEFDGCAREIKQFRNLFVEQEDCALAIVSKPGKIQLLSPPDAWFAAANLGLEIAPRLPAITAALRSSAENDAEIWRLKSAIKSMRDCKGPRPCKTCDTIARAALQEKPDA